MRKHSIRIPQSARQLLALAAGAALLLSLGLAAPAPAAQKSHGQKHAKGHKKHKKTKARKASAPLSGIYDACAYSDPKQTPLPDCDDRLLALRQGGFRVV